MKTFYSIGLDLGTNSVGWAVIDQSYQVLKRGGKKLWGVVLFEEGKSSKDYRLNRSARRRLERRKQRISQLQMLMRNSILSVDKDFFHRLKYSFLINDKIDSSSIRDYKYNLFNGDFTDKDFYKKYKTIYHLRKSLCEEKEKVDIRLIYLALHHIVKYRGHFLLEGDVQTDGNSIDDKLAELSEIANKLNVEIHNDKGDLLGEELHFGEEYRKELLNKEKFKKDKITALKQLGGKGPLSEFIANALMGKSVDVKKVLNVECENGKSISFASDFEEAKSNIYDSLTEEQIDFIELLHEIYLQITLIGILGEGNESVSTAMIKKYDKHQNDLKVLKELLKTNKDLYDKMFKLPRSLYKNKNDVEKKKRLEELQKLASYTNYVRTSTSQTRYNGEAKVTREGFYKFVKESLNDFLDCEKKSYVLAEIEKETFMPLINDVSNSAIPYQLNLAEMDKILANQSEFYPELKENADKIKSILTFRRPYSVGVLNTSLQRGESSKFSWIDQQIAEKVYPWNFEDKVDLESANQKFIENMVGRDVFTGTLVLPLQSITYQKYSFLNEISNLRYKSNPLSAQEKQAIYNFAIEKDGATVSKKDIIKVLRDKFGIDYESEKLSGFSSDGENPKLISTLKTYREFSRIYFKDTFRETDVDKYDKIVETLTVFKDQQSKKRVLGKLFKKWKFDTNLVDKLATKSYSGWGRYSVETLCHTLSNEPLPRSILELLYETDKNMQSILFDENLGIRKQTVDVKTFVEKPTYKSIIEPLYASASVKKTVWQAYKVVEEIVKIMGCEPELVFVESARTNDEKKRTKPRFDKLKELYKEIRKDVNYYRKEVEDELDARKDQGQLDAEKVYLYMLQLGRCMYTGRQLSLDRLGDYEVDHILPRSFIKDDSVENKVLVIKEANQRKTSLALSNEIIQNQTDFWSFLLKQNFISKKKFDNLTKNDWTEKELNGFINRQLTETNQINKCMMTVLKMAYPTLENCVVGVKSGLITTLRKRHTEEDSQEYGDFYKLRNLNDFHHAKDAYLVASMGLFSRYYFNAGDDAQNMARYNYIKHMIKERSMDEKNTRALVNKGYGIMVDAFCKGCYTCVNEDGEEVLSSVAYENFLKTMSRNDISVVFKTESWANPNFYGQTLYAKLDISGKEKLQPKKYVTDKSGNKIPLSPQLYGGYSQEEQAYYLKIQYQKGKKLVEEFIGVPTLIATQYKNGDKNSIQNWLNKEKGVQVTILGKEISKYQLIRYGGQLVYVKSDNELSNAQQLIVNKKYHKLLSVIENELKSDKKEKTFDRANLIENADLLAKEFVCDYVERVEKYYPLFANINLKVKEFLDNGFNELTLAEKCQYISYLLIVTQQGPGRVTVDKKYNGGSEWGRLKNKTIIPSNVDWINQSITGYYTTITPAKK